MWLKRAIGDIYPDIFLTPLTPKKKEIVAYTINKSWDESKDFFERMLKNSFKEIYRVLKPNGIAIIVYAHKTTEGWETVINSLIDSGLTVTASWPLSTERKSRQGLRIQQLYGLPYIVAVNKKRILDSIMRLKMRLEDIYLLNSINYGKKEYLELISLSQQ